MNVLDEIMTTNILRTLISKGEGLRMGDDLGGARLVLEFNRNLIVNSPNE